MTNNFPNIIGNVRIDQINGINSYDYDINKQRFSFTNESSDKFSTLTNNGIITEKIRLYETEIEKVTE